MDRDVETLNSIVKTEIAAEQEAIISGEGILRSKTKPLPSAVSLYPFSQPICRGFAEQVSSCSTYSCGNGAHEEEKEGFTVPALPKQLTIIFKAELK